MTLEEYTEANQSPVEDITITISSGSYISDAFDLGERASIPMRLYIDGSIDGNEIAFVESRDGVVAYRDIYTNDNALYKLTNISGSQVRELDGALLTARYLKIKTLTNSGSTAQTEARTLYIRNGQG